MKSNLKKNFAGKALQVGLGLAMVGGMPGRTAAQANGLGYVLGGPGFVTYCCADSIGVIHVGGGGEAIFGQGLGIGAEVGLAGSVRRSEGFGFWLLSVNGSYHFAHEAATQPFVTTGYSLGSFLTSHDSLWNLGGGVDHWMTPRVGLRIELRDHVLFNFENGSPLHAWEPRIGIVIRGR